MSIFVIFTFTSVVFPAKSFIVTFSPLADVLLVYSLVNFNLSVDNFQPVTSCIGSFAVMVATTFPFVRFSVEYVTFASGVTASIFIEEKSGVNTLFVLILIFSNFNVPISFLSTLIIYVIVFLSFTFSSTDFTSPEPIEYFNTDLLVLSNISSPKYSATTLILSPYL